MLSPNCRKNLLIYIMSDDTNVPKSVELNHILNKLVWLANVLIFASWNEELNNIDSSGC